MKNKGFTLIELLAVIVILAIIALIAVPIILNIINSSRESAKERSRELYGKAVENAVMKYQMKGEALPDGTYKLDTTTGEICRYIDTVKQDECITPEVNGTIPESYTMEIESEKIIGQTMTLKQTSYKKVGNGQWEVKPETNNDEEQAQAQDTYAYLWYDGSNVAGPSIGGDASSLSTSAPSNKENYLKFKLDDTNKVTNSYACAIFGGEEYCVEGGGYDKTTETSPYYGWNTDEAHSTGNVKVLYDSQSPNITGFSCGFNSDRSYCRAGSVYLDAHSSGTVGFSDAGVHCNVNGDGSSFCGVA